VIEIVHLNLERRFFLMLETLEDPDERVEDELGEADSEEHVIYSINSFGADFLIDGLIRRLDSEDIYRPHFQRKFVWTVPQASKFIESILLGLPIPGIFLYREENTKKHLIIDGLQRLTTISAFASGFFPGSDHIFRLTNLKSKFKDKSIKDLDSEEQRGFFDTAIHATIIQQLTPEDDASSAYYIFERLNTGGTPLQPEEIRAALFHGPFQDFLSELNKNLLWREVFGPEHKRSKDLELLLRFFAFRYRRAEYKAPMKTFLNRFMSFNRRLNRYEPSKLSSDFITALCFITDAIGLRPFRPVRALNVAAFDSVMAIVSENIDEFKENKAEFAKNYNRLMADSTFLSLITRSTASEQSVRDRFAIVEEYLMGLK
jgi:hypothetical protein